MNYGIPLQKTEDGFEMHLGTNHLGHFLLTELLIPRLHASSTSDFKPRIIIVSSSQHEKGFMNWNDIHFETNPENYKGFTSYNQSKLANVMHAIALSRRHERNGLRVYTLHPGIIGTDIMRNMQKNILAIRILYSLFGWLFRFVVKTPYNGAQTTIFCAVDKGIEKESGKYYSDCKEKRST